MSKLKIVFLDSATLSIGDIDYKELSELGVVVYYDRTLPQDIVHRSKDADILITNKVVITDRILSNLPNLKYICVAATGYNNVDVIAAKQRSIPVSNVSGYSTNGVAQHVFALLLDVVHRVGGYNQQVSKGRWQSSLDFSFYDHSIFELKDKVLGIYGFGSIGRRVAELGQVFGMKVISHHKHPERDAMQDVTFLSLEEIVEQSDVLSLHAPLSEGNKGIFDYNLLSKMKSKAILINTARGPLINEQDLAIILNENKISFACLDVLNEEPPKADHPLIGLRNCIITPHQAWATKESRQRLLEGLVANIKAFTSGSYIQNRVD